MLSLPPKPVIHPGILPGRSPLVVTLVAWLILDRFSSPGWVWGAVGVLLALWWIFWIIDMAQRDYRYVEFIKPSQLSRTKTPTNYDPRQES